LLYNHKFIPTYPNQIIVNRYQVGEGIQAHADHPMFDSVILSISLESPVIMTFKPQQGVKGAEVDIPLIPGSLLVMTGESRDKWTHSIPARKSDTYEVPGLPVQKWTRGERISVTYRTLRTQFRGDDLRSKVNR